MLHRTEEGNSPVWEMNESQLAPIVEDLTQETESFSTDNNQFSETNLAPTLLIGLDKSFFAQGDISKDIVFIDSNGIKLGPSEIKIDADRKGYLASGNYLISFVEAEKSPSWNNSSELNTKSDEGIPQVYNESVEESVDKIVDISQQDENHLFNAHHFPTPEEELGIDDNIFINKDAVSDQTNTRPKNVNDTKLKVPSKKKSRKNLSTEPIKGETISASKPILVKKRRFRKRRCCYSDSEDSDGDTSTSQVFEKITDHGTFKSVEDLVDDLKFRELVDNEFGETILAGLKEMKINILEELQSVTTVDRAKPSNELLVFAFLLHYKNPPSFRYLQLVFGEKWPTLAEIKEWKQLVNSKPKKKTKAKKR